MDRKDRLRYGKYLRKLANKMELRDWCIFTQETPAEDGRVAEARCTYGRKGITIQFQIGFEKLDRAEQRQVCVHELLHAHFGAHDQHMHDARKMMNKYWLHQLGDIMHVHLEYGIDAISDIIAPHMPLPPAKKPKKKVT